jgi:RimJ/RimL family protein N-acetyltransferase
MRYFKKLVGEKCYLSPMNPDDYEAFTLWLNDLEVTRNLRLANKSISLPGERDILVQLAQEHTYAIVDLQTDTLLGNLGLIDIDSVSRSCGIGIFIGNKDYWGQGYGREALRLLMRYAFDYLNINNIMLTVYEFNERGIRCYRSIGFREIGRRRKCIFREGRYYDHVFMDILAEEFRQTPA